MRIPCLVILATAAFLSGCGQYAPGRRAYSDDGVRWGPAVNGLKVGIARRNYRAGREPGADQVYFSVQLLNTSGRELSILAPVPKGGTIPEALSGDESVKVKLTYDSAAGLKTAQFTPPKKPVVQRMGPGEAYRMELRLSPGKFGLDRFVAGRMSATYSNSQETIQYESTGNQPVKGLWTGDVTSGEVAFDAAPPATQEKSAVTASPSGSRPNAEASLPVEQGGGAAR